MVQCGANTWNGTVASTLSYTPGANVTTGDYVSVSIEQCAAVIHGTCPTGTYTAAPLYETDTRTASTGTVNVTAGGLVTFVSGIAFNMGGQVYSGGNLWVGKSVTINSVASAGTVSSVSSMTQMQLSGYSGGAQTGVSYSVSAWSCTETSNFTFAATSTCRGFVQSTGSDTITANGPSNSSLGQSFVEISNSSGIQGEDVYSSIMPTAAVIDETALRDFRYLGYEAGEDVSVSNFTYGTSDASELAVFSQNNESGTISAGSGWTGLIIGRSNATQLSAKYISTAANNNTATMNDTDTDDEFLGSIIPLVQTGSTAPSLPPSIQPINTVCGYNTGNGPGCSNAGAAQAYFAYPLTPGSVIIAHTINYSGSTSVPADTNAVLTFNACASGLNNVAISGGGDLGCYCAYNASSTSVSDQFTISAGSFISVTEYIGLKSCTADVYGSYPNQTSGSGSNNMKTAGSGSGITPTKNGDLIYSSCATNSGSPTPGTSNTGLNVLGQEQYLVQATAATINPTMTDSASSDGVGCLAAAFQPFSNAAVYFFTGAVR